MRQHRGALQVLLRRSSEPVALRSITGGKRAATLRTGNGRNQNHQEETRMTARWLTLAAAAVGLTLGAAAAQAQTKLKWAHVYETSEPFHTQSVWAAGEIAKRTNNRYQVDVYLASQLGKETDINQGLSLGSVDMIISSSSFAARRFP